MLNFGTYYLSFTDVHVHINHMLWQVYFSFCSTEKFLRTPCNSGAKSPRRWTKSCTSWKSPVSSDLSLPTCAGFLPSTVARLIGEPTKRLHSSPLIASCSSYASLLLTLVLALQERLCTVDNACRCLNLSNFMSNLVCVFWFLHGTPYCFPVSHWHETNVREGTPYCCSCYHFASKWGYRALVSTLIQAAAPWDWCGV